MLRAAVALWFDDNAAAVARYGPIGDWDTRDVKSMRDLFKYRADFDEDIGRWSVGGVEDMGCMFYGAASFNQPLDKWDVSSVEDMCGMFYFAAKFNRTLDKWDVSSVKSMYRMFRGAASFNQPLDKWDVSSVENMEDMFDGAASFNQPATLTRFDLVTPPPPLACVRTDTHAHAVRPHRQPRRSRRAHICSARVRTAVLRYTRARNLPVARTLERAR